MCAATPPVGCHPSSHPPLAFPLLTLPRPLPPHPPSHAPQRGRYELVYVPASRGSFEAQVLCVRDVREQEAAPKSKWTRLGPPKKTLLEAAQLAATLKTEEVPGFQTFDVKVAPTTFHALPRPSTPVH